MSLHGRPALVGVALLAGLALACIAVDAVLGSIAVVPAGGVAFVALNALLGSVAFVAAALVAWRRPQSIVAVLLALLGLQPNLSGLADVYGHVWHLAPDQVPMS